MGRPKDVNETVYNQLHPVPFPNSLLRSFLPSLTLNRMLRKRVNHYVLVVETYKSSYISRNLVMNKYHNVPKIQKR